MLAGLVDRATPRPRAGRQGRYHENRRVSGPCTSREASHNILLPCLIYTVFYTARAIRLDYTPVPIWDSWRSVQYLDRLLKFDLRHFWVQHNEHRIGFPEMVYALDYIFFPGEQLLPIACNVACQLAQASLKNRMPAIVGAFCTHPGIAQLAEQQTLQTRNLWADFCYPTAV